MFLLIDKPKGMTSHDVVDKVRKITGIKKVGHGGTLDPNATGLLIIGITRESTKKLGIIAKDTKKTYEAEVFLGEARDTDDVEGEILSMVPEGTTPPSAAKIQSVLDSFSGRQIQTPPAHSAIKIKGKKAYEMARAGKDVEIPEREITVYSIKLEEYKYPILKFTAEVSSGTYIRSLARDIGEKLGTFGYLSNLRRTKIGEYSIDNAISIDKLDQDNWKEYTI